MSARRSLQLLWAAVAVQLLGRLIDLRWHVTHDDFEGAADQLQAHWLAWLGVAATIVVAALALRTEATPASLRGYRTVLIAGLAYVPVSVWHFIEHANGADPELAHLLLGVTQIAMLVGVIRATLGARPRRARARSESVQ